MKNFFILLFTLTLLPVMAYSADADLYDRIDQETVIELTDDDSSGSVDQTVLTNTRDDVSQFIDAHLRGQYDLPISPTPGIIKNIEADLLVVSLYERRPHIEIPDTLKRKEKKALKLLEAISAGTIELQDQPDPGKGNYVTNRRSTDRRFPSDILNKF